jgi:large subunit ribosomal protein L18
MKKKVKKIYLQKKKRYLKKIVGNSIKPRLSVFRSNYHIYAQLIDDKLGHTLASCSTLDFEASNVLIHVPSIEVFRSATKEAAFAVGLELANRALSKDIQTVVFDRQNRAYHGRIEKLADGARQKGLIF